MPKKLTVAQKLKATRKAVDQAVFRATCTAWCANHGLPEPLFEFRFHPDRRWRLDISWPESKVAVEVHGGLFRFGHHSRGKGFLDDREKIATAISMGWKVFEVAPGGSHPNTLYSPQLLAWLKGSL